MEYAEGGSLTRAIKYALLSRWEDKERITQDIIRGLHYLHSNDILHRDLKTDNVLLTKNFDTAKLCDFGLSMTEHHTADNEDSSAAVSHAGTRRWMAPELFDPNPAYSKKSDIYALGWIMWQIVSSRVKPFQHIRDPSKVIELIKDGKRETIPAKISEDYRKSIEACWHQDPSQRPHAEEMIKKDALTEVGYNSDFISISVSGLGNSSSEWVPVDRAHYNRTTSGDVSQKEAAKEVDIIQLAVADYNLRIEYLFDQSQSSTSETTPLDPLLSTGPAPQIVVRDFRGEDVVKGRALPVSSLTTHENSGNRGNVSHAVHIMSNQISADLVRRAKDNDVEAQFALAALYETGSDDAAKSDSTAFFWYHQAAKQGHLYGQRRLAELYYHGRGTPKSYTDAVGWYKMAAERGDAISQYQLGLLYETGRGVEKSDVEAAIWYHKSAEQGEADAQDKLGSMYQIGRGVEKSYNEAFEWYFRAAEQGHTDSQYHIGLMYKEGQGREVNYTIASKWLRKAADKGHSRAQHSLDEVNTAVQRVEKSKQRATLGIEKAAEQGNIDAQVKLGSMFANGRGVGQSYTKAIEWYRRAADQKSETAQYHLGLMYELGHGVEKSDVEAVAWYRKAAEQGSADAQYRLGMMYAVGRGVEQSDVEAVSWYRMAAYQENEVAQHNLGLMQQIKGLQPHSSALG
ncbi:hypothetical protein BGW42_002767 [Actinomortierella wolfii]|nr:hypothetical protein BGW42_002767 [Actinomortierella wolfii]